MTALTRTLLTGAALASVLALAACSTAATTSGGGTGSSNNPNSIATSVEPVEAYLASAENDWRVAMRAHFASNQEKIARCMKTAGFDYTPSTLPPNPAPVNQNTEAWVAKHGYGMSPADQKVSERTEIILNTPYGIDAPAQTKYVNSLSKAERGAYETALNGPENQQSISAQAGCMKGQPIDPRFTPAATKLAEDSFSYQGAASTDPRTTKAQAEWATCMVKAGHQGLATPDDAQTKIDALYSPDNGSKVDQDKGRPVTGSAGLAAAHKAEIAMALDDFDCKVKTKYTERVNAVLYGLEDKWISTHKPVLDDVIAGYRQASK